MEMENRDKLIENKMRKILGVKAGRHSPTLEKETAKRRDTMPAIQTSSSSLQHASSILNPLFF